MSEISKKQNEKFFLLSAGAVGMTEQRQVAFLHTFQGAKVFYTKVIILYWRHGPQHMPRDRNATDYEKFCLVTTTPRQKWFYIRNSSVLRYTTSTSNNMQYLSCQGLKTTPETTTDINKHVGLFLFRNVLKTYLNLAIYHENLVVKCWEHWPGSTSN